MILNPSVSIGLFTGPIGSAFRQASGESVIQYAEDAFLRGPFPDYLLAKISNGNDSGGGGKGPTVDEWVQKLKHADVGVRKRAALEFVRGFSRKPESARSVAEALMKEFDFEGEGTKLEIKHASDEISYCWEDRISLVRALRNKKPDVRGAAALLYGLSGHLYAVDPLARISGDSDVEIRRIVARSLGLTGHVHAVDPLIRMLEDDDARVRYCAAESLGYIGDRRAVALLMEMAARDEGHWLSDGYKVLVRWAAIYALGRIGGPGVMEFLIKGLEDKDDRYRSWAIDAIEEMQTPDLRAIEALIAIKESSDDNDLKEKAGDALELLWINSDPESFLEFLKHENPSVRRYAFTVLDEMCADRSSDEGTLDCAMEGAELLLQRRYESAIDCFNVAISLDPGSLLAYFLMLRAEAELGMEHWAEAEDDFRRAIEIDPMLRKRLEPLIADARFRKGAL